MNTSKNIFLGKKILIYGLGKSGISTYKFLKNKAKLYLFDDNSKTKFQIIELEKVLKTNFDIIVISPGIDISNCKLSKFLKKNFLKIYTDLDVFCSFYNNKSITITGTNGKSTTCKLLYEVLNKHGLDVKLAGNIGFPILSIKNVKPKSIFIIEASSYQLDYSKLFYSKYGVILNISVDHLERHKSLKNYINAKLKLFKNQKKGSLAFINKHDVNLKKEIIKKKYDSKLIEVNTKLDKKFINIFQNKYFQSISNRENLSFVLSIAKYFKLKKNIVIDVIKNFKGLNYRQQIIFSKKNISVINDSKSTSYSSSLEMLKSLKNIYWLLGGIPKKGDKFNLPKKYYKNIKCYIFGKNFKKFSKDLKDKINFKKFSNLKKALEAILKEIDIDDGKMKTILFSPSAASFDTFKNFEYRGSYFNKLIKKYFNVK